MHALSIASLLTLDMRHKQYDKQSRGIREITEVQNACMKSPNMLKIRNKYDRAFL